MCRYGYLALFHEKTVQCMMIITTTCSKVKFMGRKCKDTRKTAQNGREMLRYSYPMIAERQSIKRRRNET